MPQISHFKKYHYSRNHILSITLRKKKHKNAVPAIVYKSLTSNIQT